MKKLMILGASILQLPAIKKAEEMGVQALWVLPDDSNDYTDGYLVYSKNYGGVAAD